MKKTLIAAAVMAASGVAFAASNVTLYGVLDGGVQLSKTKGSANVVSFDSGNFMGSRWGIKGVEDLGNGNAIGFQLEQGFNMDSGNASASSRAFHRISRLYVKGSWGEFGFGRFGSLSSGTGPYSMLDSWGGSLLATSFGSTNAWDVIAGNTGRVNNALVYVSPSFAGFKLSAMYSNGVDDDTAKWADNQHYYGIGASYAAGGLKSSLIFDVRDNKGKANSYTITEKVGTADVDIANNVKKAIYSVNYGLSYNFGPITPQFGYTFTTQDDVASQHTFGLSATAPVAGGEAALGARYVFGQLDGQLKRAFKEDGDETKYRLLTINAMYKYNLSKRTSVYGYAGWTDGAKLYKDTGKIGNWFTGSAINSNGYSVALGLVHSF